MNIYETRREKIYDWMARENITLVMFEDTEARRDTSIRWMTGHPGDALLFLSVDKQALLVPWDINMAKIFAAVDMIIPYADFDRHSISALKAGADYFKTPYGSKVEIPPATPYPIFLQYVEALTDFDIICRSGGIRAEVEALRTIKDEEELRIYREVSAITNTVIELLEKNVRAGTLKTEADIALFIEAEGRKRGCEGTGFETLAAGPGRSFGIHAFPAYTAGDFAAPGLSILDFGLKYAGYTSDVTLTFVREPLSRSQEKLLSLTEKAYKLALSLIGNGAAARDIAHAVDAFFDQAKKRMPHGLGHGIGLEAHEAPALRNRTDNAWILKPGMIVTLEPGLYDPVHGGCRLENDILITETGAVVLTNAKIIRL
ncbi:MAG: Xaa-Pro peptidase family protein [Treponema sp.]|jgi:Xaa-Pro dipeptidase|nr:Xaa-Pro peptidase family protein [Treponema sp.]